MNILGRSVRVVFSHLVRRKSPLQAETRVAASLVRYVHRPVALAPAPRPSAPTIEELPEYDTFSPSVCQFIAERKHENQNSGVLSWVTSLRDDSPVGIVELNDFVFAENPRIDILHRVVVWQRAKRRAGTACVKGRSEVRGGGRKPWPQKGLGKARQGSIRAPQFRGGGVVHGPKPRDYEYTLPKKVRRMGLRVALSVRYAQGDLHIVESFDDIEQDKDLIPILEHQGWTSAVLVDGLKNATLADAAEDLRKVDVYHSENVNVYSILLRHKIIISLDGVRRLEERLCEDNRILQNQFG
ncbi:uncharacterized protein LOC116305254 [Actinia tenebrosa]|uniref:Large ribosomal subunit protein uL4m n=1 Tax=Actinia tenebrosa TaxID=6105 RepID=A0A6P8IV75_ACTTE|nr:uncharacterized protein LOC116305254 [Actinia tenebrosa]